MSLELLDQFAVRQRPHLLDRLSQNAYLTEGRRLFRCLPGPDAGTLTLEDCRTLDLILWEESDLLAARMQIVRSPQGDCA